MYGGSAYLKLGIIHRKSTYPAVNSGFLNEFIVGYINTRYAILGLPQDCPGTDGQMAPMPLPT